MKDEFYKDLVNSIEDYAIFRLDIGGIVTSWNPGAEKLKGYKENEIIGKHFSIFYTKEDLRSEKPVNELLQASTVGKYHEQGWRVKKDGSRFWADVTITAIFNKDKRLEGFSKITKDFTKSYLADSKEKQKFELMLHAGNIGTFEWNLDNNQFIWSEELYKIFGMDTTVKITDIAQFEEILFEDDRERIGKAIEEAITTGKIYDEEYRVVHPDKSVHWVHARGKVMRNSEGRPTTFVGALNNIDLQKANEAVLKIQLKEQTLKLRNAQASLVNAAKMSALGEMAGGIAHEINTPLASITINAQFLERAMANEKADPKFVEIATNIRETAIKIGKIIKGLRSFARNADEDEMTEASLEKILNDVSSLCINRFKNQETEFLIENNAGDIVLKCRAIQVEQVIMNLLNNAYDALAEVENKKVVLSTELTPENLEIRVSDSGHGIRPQNAEKILQPFFTTKPLGKGTGLGLSISKGIVESHGGKLYLDKDSPLTTFCVCLPRSLVLKLPHGIPEK